MYLFLEFVAFNSYCALCNETIKQKKWDSDADADEDWKEIFLYVFLFITSLLPSRVPTNHHQE